MIGLSRCLWNQVVMTAAAGRGLSVYIGIKKTLKNLFQFEQSIVYKFSLCAVSMKL